MVMDVRKTILLVKAEAIYDTDASPVGTADIILATDVQIKENSGIETRDAQWKFLGRYPSILSEQWAEVSFKVKVYGSGVAGTAPRLGALLKACGLSETVISNTSVTYAPVSANHGSCTIYVYKDGRLHIMTGCKGDAKQIWKAGNALEMEFTLQGRYAAPTVVALPASIAYESTVKVPPVCKSSVFTYNAKTSLVVGQMDFALGNKVVKRVSLNDPNAIIGFEITDRMPTFGFDPEAQFQTSYNFRSDLLTTQRAISLVANRAAGNIITLNIPFANITKIGYGDREGIVIEKIEGDCSESAGDDSFSIVFT